MLRVQGDFRRRLAPIGVTPFQAGVILYLHRHPDAKVTEAATALGVLVPTLSGVIRDLVRKRWVIRRRALHDDRLVCLRLSRQGDVVARRITDHVHRCEGELGKGNLLRLGQRVAKGTTH